MSIETVLTIVLGGGLIGSVLAFWTTRHRPRVDNAQLVITGQTGFIDNLQEQLTSANDEVRDLKAALKACEDQARMERGRHDTAIREERARGDGLLKQNGALADRLDVALGHLWLLETGITEATIPPLPARPLALRHLIHVSHAGDRTVYDTGVPGVDPNPPPDDGQPMNPEESP